MATNRKSVPRKTEILFRVGQTDFFDLFLDRRDDDFQKVLPAGSFQVRGKLTRDEF